MPPRGSRRVNRNTKKVNDDNREQIIQDEDSNGLTTPSSGKSREISVENSIKDVNEKEQEEEENSSNSDDSDEDNELPILMVSERLKRATAGNKMAELMASADQEDEFYKTAYGGFQEGNDADEEFNSPVPSDEDEVDSDFDKPEEEDEPISGDENDVEKKQKKRKFKEPRRGITADDILAKNRKWAMARLAGNIVAANSVDEKTQVQMLKEAERTEKINIESLKKYEEYELEKKKKREKTTIRIFPPGPREQLRMTKNETTLTLNEIKKFKCQRSRPRNVCAVTGRPAKYFDPITKLPYSTAYAFKVIRDKYNKYLKTLKGNEEVANYLQTLKNMPTPPDSPVPISLNPTSMVAESALS